MKAPGNWRKLEAHGQMLSTINSTNPPPPNSTASATESYSSQCRYRKASRPSLFECLGPQKTATVLLNNIYRTPVSGIFRGLWRKPGQRFAVCGGIPVWQMNVSRTIAVKNQGGRRGARSPCRGYLSGGDVELGVVRRENRRDLGDFLAGVGLTIGADQNPIKRNARGISTTHRDAGPKLTSVETFSTFDPASRHLALAARPLQKHFACRPQFTTTHQFDAWGLLRRDSKRVRISISAQHLPVIQLHRRANK